MPMPQRHQHFQVLVLQVANFGFGSLGGSFPPYRNRLLPRDKPSAHVGFCRPTQFSAEQFAHSGAKPTPWRVPNFVRD